MDKQSETFNDRTAEKEIGLLTICFRTLGLMLHSRIDLFILLTVLVVFSSGAAPIILWVNRLVVDSVVEIVGGYATPAVSVIVSEVGPYFLVIFFVWVLSNAAKLFSEGIRNSYGMHLSYDFQQRIAEKSARLDLEVFDHSEFYDMVEQARKESTWRPLNLVSVGGVLLSHVVDFLAMGYLTYAIHPLALPLLIITTAPRALASLKYSKKYYKIWANRQPERREAEYLIGLLSSRAYAGEVRLTGIANEVIGRFRKIADRLVEENLALEFKRMGADAFLYVFSAAGLLVVWVLAVIKVISGGGSIGDLTLYFGASSAVCSALRGGLFQAGILYENALFLRSFFTFMDLEVQSNVEVDDYGGELKTPDSVDMNQDNGFPCIKFSNVSFRYPGSKANTLNHLSLDFTGPKLIAIVGHNGAGKTTLVKLLTRLYEPNEGTVLVNGQDIRTMCLQDYRALFGVMFQDYCRYELSVRDNVCFGGSLGSSDEAIYASLKASGADRIIGRFPNRLETRLGRSFANGMELSSGEWQKIALARLFLRNSPILILDEPTSAMDIFSEYDFHRELHAIRRSKLVIVVSHRFSTVQMSDLIYVLDEGHLVEQGTHYDLLNAGGYYSKMYTSHVKMYGDPGELEKRKA